MPIAFILPATWKLILYGVVSMVGFLGAWFINRMFVKWLNEYEDAANAKTATDARSQTQSDDQKANAESDALAKIEGR